jgi:hypothetical protein
MDPSEIDTGKIRKRSLIANAFRQASATSAENPADEVGIMIFSRPMKPTASRGRSAEQSSR